MFSDLMFFLVFLFEPFKGAKRRKNLSVTSRITFETCAVLNDLLLGTDFLKKRANTRHRVAPSF